jgi:hypothetical protein
MQLTAPADYIAAIVPEHCALCKRAPVAGRNLVWLCYEHFREALALMIAGERLAA